MRIEQIKITQRIKESGKSLHEKKHEGGHKEPFGRPGGGGTERGRMENTLGDGSK